MNEFKFSCPKCGQHMVCEEEHSGRKIKCPGCKESIYIPPVPGRTAQYVQDSGLTWGDHLGSDDAPPPSTPPGSSSPPEEGGVS